jgi:hypothetical protein
MTSLALLTLLVGCGAQQRVYDRPYTTVVSNVVRMYDALEGAYEQPRRTPRPPFRTAEGTVVPDLHGEHLLIDHTSRTSPRRHRIEVVNVYREPWALFVDLAIEPAEEPGRTKVEVTVRDGRRKSFTTPRDRSEEQQRLDEISRQLGTPIPVE